MSEIGDGEQVHGFLGQGQVQENPFNSIDFEALILEGDTSEIYPAVRPEATNMEEFPDLASINTDWSTRQYLTQEALKALHGSLKDFDEILDTYAEDGNIETVKDRWNNTCKPQYNATERHLNVIESYDSDILESKAG